MYLKDCVTCKDGEVYDEQKHDCFKKLGVEWGASLETTMAIAFSHEHSGGEELKEKKYND